MISLSPLADGFLVVYRRRLAGAGRPCRAARAGRSRQPERRRDRRRADLPPRRRWLRHPGPAAGRALADRPAASRRRRCLGGAAVRGEAIAGGADGVALVFATSAHPASRRPFSRRGGRSRSRLLRAPSPTAPSSRSMPARRRRRWPPGSSRRRRASGGGSFSPSIRSRPSPRSAARAGQSTTAPPTSSRWPAPSTRTPSTAPSPLPTGGCGMPAARRRRRNSPRSWRPWCGSPAASRQADIPSTRPPPGSPSRSPPTPTSS